MPDVRPFTHLIIGHDGAGPHPGVLHLQHIHTDTCVHKSMLQSTNICQCL
jgi:hypothetical protein